MSDAYICGPRRRGLGGSVLVRVKREAGGYMVEVLGPEGARLTNFVGEVVVDGDAWDGDEMVTEAVMVEYVSAERGGEIVRRAYVKTLEAAMVE